MAGVTVMHQERPAVHHVVVSRRGNQGPAAIQQGLYTMSKIRREELAKGDTRSYTSSTAASSVYQSSCSNSARSIQLLLASQRGR